MANEKFHALGRAMDDGRFYYYMIAVEIVYSIDHEDETKMGSRHMNVMVISKRDVFGLAEIAKIHLGVQKQLDEKMVGQPYQLIDTVILTINKLGRFTQEEFNDPQQPKI